MKLGHRIHGGRELFDRPRAYEITTAIAFGGRRRRIYDDLIELGGVGLGHRVLDVGCGPGYLARRAGRVVGPSGRVDGIDPSPEAIAYARRRASANVTYTVGAAEDLPYADDTFDVVLSSLALHHIRPDQRAVALAEVRRVLRPNGRLLVVELGPPSDGVVSRIVQKVGGHGRGDHDLGDLSGLIAEAGFVVTGQGDRAHRMRYVQAGPRTC